MQEAFTNTAKYANAIHVQLGLQRSDSEMRISVSENGSGFDIATVPRSSHGLTGMRYRVEAHGGRIKLESAIGQGTRIDAWLPSGSIGAYFFGFKRFINQSKVHLLRLGCCLQNRRFA